MINNRALALVALLATATTAAEDVAAWYPGLVRDGRLIASASHLGQELRTVEVPQDKALFTRKANFGYSLEDVQRYFAAPLRYAVDTTGLDRHLLTPAPKAGLHPRVWFNAEDLPAIRERQKTAAGMAAMDAIRAHLTKLLTGPSAIYAVAYAALVKGDAKVDLYAQEQGELGFLLPYEAFRCLIDQDQEGGRRIAAALATVAPAMATKVRDNVVKAKDAYTKARAAYTAAKEQGKPVVPPIDRANDFNTVGLAATFQGTYGLAYDFAHGFMSEAQRAAVRRTLATATAGMTNIGCEAIPVLRASNHIPWENRLIEAVTAIEGEDGFDPTTYQRCVSAQTNFVTTGIFPSGEAFEGWAKSFMFLEHAIVMAKRGNDLVAATNLRVAFNDYFVAAMNPWGGGFTFCDSLGGSGIKIARNADVAMYRALFPQDLAGQVIYANQLDGDPKRIIGNQVNTHHPFAVTDALLCAIYATDLPITDLGEARTRISVGRSPTYFSEDTGNLITRSAWDADALYLHYLTRTVPGGHVYADRSHFSLYGLGRFWSIYQNSRQIHEQYGPVMRSVLLCDNEGPSTMEGRCAAFVDRPLATLTASDLTDTWNYQKGYVVRAPKGMPTFQHPFSYNHFRRLPSPQPWMDAPIPLIPNWDSSRKPESGEANDWYRRPLQVQKAFRTASLIRGTHPYVLIADDLQVDNQERNYDWTMVMAPDLVLGAATVTGTPEQPTADIRIDELSGDRHLLVRVMSAAALDAQTPATVDLTPVPNPPMKDLQVNKLHIPSHCVRPDFRMLLVPHRTGEALPTTTWSTDRTTVTIAWSDQRDDVTFTPGKDGRTRIRITREGTDLLREE
jgi:hypothetical protein